jgi:ArsR family transcriptional regulator, arsenate/arsenite/antimonite-responsive transcriptional repressor
MTSEEIALVCKALGDNNRLQIIQLLSGGEMCACKLLEKFNITQPTLSHHMKILCECGLVEMRREGKWAHYSLNCGTLTDFKQFIGQLSCCTDTGTECTCL